MFLRRASHRTAARLSAATQSPVSALLEPLEGRRLLSTGAAAAAAPGVPINGDGVVFQGNGKAVVLDSDVNGHAVLERFLPGSSVNLDPSFGNNGRVVTSLDAISDVALTGDGKIVIAGNDTVARFNADGSVDTTFGPQHTGAVTVSNAVTLRAVAVQGDGKIVAAGRNGAGSNLNYIAVLRLNADGSADTSFGSKAGEQDIPMQSGASADAFDVTVEPSGKIAVVGQQNGPTAQYWSPIIDQLLPSGAPDTSVTFANPNGVGKGGFFAVIPSPDGGLIAAGEGVTLTNPDNAVVVHYNANGQIVGQSVLPAQDDNHLAPYMTSLALTPDNKILAAGTIENSHPGDLDYADFFVQRFNLDGTLDPNFGKNGTVYIDGGGTDGSARVALASDGSFYLSGTTDIPDSTGTNQPPPAPFLLHVSADARTGPFGNNATQLPGRVEAENYDVGGEGLAYHDTDEVNQGGAYRSDGVDIEAVGTGYAVDWTHSGEWLDYTVHTTAHNSFQVVAHVASVGAGASFHIDVDGVDATGPVYVPDTGSWTNYADVTATVNIADAGDHVIRVVMDGQTALGFSGNYDYFQFNASGGPTSQPYGGTPFTGSDLVEAENFDLGGEGIAYHDTEPQNLAGQYRPSEGVDIESTPDLVVAGHGSEYDVGWTHAGERLNYTGNFANYSNGGGTYDLYVRAANAGAGGSFHVNVDGVNVTGTLAIPDTGGFQTYTNVIKTGIPITAGRHVVQIVFDGQAASGYSGNLNWFRFVPETTTGYTGTPYGGTPASLPGFVQGENYDVGGEGVAYHDTDPQTNLGGAYRPNEGVDVETIPGGGYAVDYAHAGEWLKYTVNVAATSTYTLDATVSNDSNGGAFHIEVDGVDVTGTLAVPDTGSYRAYTDVQESGISLTAGQHVIRFVWDANNPSGFSGNLDSFRFT